jgi:autotransporter-associated beta strand protein
MILGSTSDTNTVNVLNPMDFGAFSRNFQVDHGAATIDGELSGVLSAGTPNPNAVSGLIKTGLGTLWLNATETYIGATVITAGTLTENGTGLLSSNSPLTVDGSTAIFDLGSNHNNTVSTVTLDGGGQITGTGTSTLTSPYFDLRSGSVTAKLAGTATPLIKSTAGIVTLSGTDTYTGATTITSSYASTIASLIVGSTGSLTLGLGNVLTDTGTAALGGTLNLTGTVGTLPETLMTYTSETGTFAAFTPPAGDKLFYGMTSLQLVVAGPSNLNWTNASTDGLWNTTSSNWNTSLGAIVTYNDTSNTVSGDNVTFSDTNNGNYNISINTAVHPTSVIVTTNNAYTFNGSGGIAGPGGLTLSGSGSLTLAEANSYQGGTNVSGGSLVLAVAGALPTGTNLSIGSGASVVANALGSKVGLVVGTLSVSGKLDLTNNGLVIRAGTIGAVTSLLSSGYNGGGWNGATGIVSTTASNDSTHLTTLGAIINDTGANTTASTGTPLYSTLDGASTADGDILVKYTYYGDANLDGAVDGSDYTLIDNGFNVHLTGWYNGDFNYDGVVDGSDYTLIDNAFNTQGASLAAVIASTSAIATAQIAGSGISAVPEPTTLGLLGIGAIGLLGRRNRRHC